MSRLDKINKALADLKKEEIAIKKLKDFVAQELMIVQAEESNMQSYVHKHSAAVLKKQLAENEAPEDSKSQMLPVQNNQAEESNMKSYADKRFKKQPAENEAPEDSRSQMVPMQNNQADESNMKSYVHKHSVAVLKKQLAENEAPEDSRSQMVPVQNNHVSNE
ncbi:hypothetical protein CEXT_68681 [Caerostris extrusa]|uniref:Uncharacterized protein n=1 Tax=Caerostris extrusa TaxID=172846 RepID=A0AAV4XWQ2_CAEEX|nr:hypothetical protein CEXT_68681 [Caerostris extrusa]